jgi:septal ring factor EnvC (AmiA/AmiB activator)
MTGLFVSSFIGERIVISGLKKEKKVTDKTEEEVKKEDDKIANLNAKINALTRDVATIKDELAEK